MVQDIVHVNLDALGMGRIDQVLEILLRLLCRMRSRRIQGIQRIVIVDIVGMVG